MKREQANKQTYGNSVNNNKTSSWLVQKWQRRPIMRRRPYFLSDVARHLASSDRFLLLFLLMVVIFIILNLNLPPPSFVYVV